jgi:hypothetical protein
MVKVKEVYHYTNTDKRDGAVSLLIEGRELNIRKREKIGNIEGVFSSNRAMISVTGDIRPC